ncbi:MAG: D-glycerate dehydrogenase [Deltaproteobacteria bacterium]|uniref:D-glycerate dehydrogenase n=1 Tax=Candidatus Zymogenus saltonus TaxID=2844893 RepID=A0A9D8PR66_9DELT|nr:D-glycerate dehydrogenase [Candidatus Zymogenus saltonus]
MKKKVLVTRRIPEAGIEILDQRYIVTVYDAETPLKKKALIKRASDCDGLLTLLTDRIDAEVIDSLPGLKGIANYAVGFDNIDIATATSRGIAVSNTPGVLTDATADLAMALIFAAGRRIVEADLFTRSGRWKGWEPTQFLGADIYGATIGIVGMGNIGKAVAVRAHGLGMKIIYQNEERVNNIEKELKAKYLHLDQLLSSADFVTLHVPLTEETRHLIGERELKMMKETAYLINTSRGKVVDESALVSALKSGEIAGAGLDVFENEPEIDRGLLKLKNAVILPHIGSATRTARTKMATMAAENLTAMLEGGKIPNLVNPEYKNLKQ